MKRRHISILADVLKIPQGAVVSSSWGDLKVGTLKRMPANRSVPSPVPASSERSDPAGLQRFRRSRRQPHRPPDRDPRRQDRLPGELPAQPRTRLPALDGRRESPRRRPLRAQGPELRPTPGRGRRRLHPHPLRHRAARGRGATPTVPTPAPLGYPSPPAAPPRPTRPARPKPADRLSIPTRIASPFLRTDHAEIRSADVDSVSQYAFREGSSAQGPRERTSGEVVNAKSKRGQARDRKAERSHSLLAGAQRAGGSKRSASQAAMAVRAWPVSEQG